MKTFAALILLSLTVLAMMQEVSKHARKAALQLARALS
jgi:Tfp pilus assembly protein PilX